MLPTHESIAKRPSPTLTSYRTLGSLYQNLRSRQIIANLLSFGGFDMTVPQGSGAKSGLWKFTQVYTTINLNFNPSSAKNKRASQPYRIPSFVKFNALNTFQLKPVSGETRQGSQSDYSSKSGLSRGAFGFSAEVSSSLSLSKNLELTISTLERIKLSASIKLS
jgi:hypothetical protein